MSNSYRIAVDTGGTFTDLCVLEENSGSMFVTKVPSTPKNPAFAVINGFTQIMDSIKFKASEISFFIHGTTVATNALLEGKGAKISFITTKGFEDVLHIGRQNRPDLYNHWIRKPKPMVSRQQCYGVDERILHTGEVLKSIEKDDVLQIIKKIKNDGIKSIGVSLLHSYANPVHENKLIEIINKEYPEAYVTLSSKVLPEFREYERGSTICINSYVMPKINDYIAFLENKLNEVGLSSGLYIMQSNGGVITAETARKISARTVLSGPAGGALTGALLAKNSSRQGNVITIDIGGTSSDISLIEDSTTTLTTEGSIEGYPIKLPMIDINTIGAGGGSIAWIDSGGALQVGPESAGAVPGPVCYGGGGKLPTVTDANAILGRINPEYLLDGAMKIYIDDAIKVMKEKVSKPLGISLLEAAEGIIKIVNANMIRGIRRVSVEKGFDPREFDLAPFGGAGPLHGLEIAESLNINRVIIPAHPGIGSAFGMLFADVRHDFVKTYIRLIENADQDKVESFFNAMEKDAISQLFHEGFSKEDIILTRRIDVRYYRQAYELTVPVSSSTFKDSTIVELVKGFTQLHNKSYGYARDNEPVEIVNLRLVALGKLPSMDLKPVEKLNKTPAKKSSRSVYFDGEKLETPVFHRDSLSFGKVIEGPAIIEQLDSTILVTPKFNASLDSYNNLILSSKEI